MSGTNRKQLQHKHVKIRFFKLFRRYRGNGVRLMRVIYVKTLTLGRARDNKVSPCKNELTYAGTLLMQHLLVDTNSEGKRTALHFAYTT